MTDVFPSLPGMGWSVFKTPNWSTRSQRSVSGVEIRQQDYINPIWNFKLTFPVLRDSNDLRGPVLGGIVSNPPGYNDLRTLMGFFNLVQGATIPFWFDDPTDDKVTGQTLPPAISAGTKGFLAIASQGNGYVVGDVISPVGGTAIAATIITVTGVGGAGNVTALVYTVFGAYTVVPGTNNIPTTGGTGTGLTIDIGWTTTVQLVRSLPGVFTENIIAPNVVSNVYFNGVPQTFTVDQTTGLISFGGGAFETTQPIITADFTYYFLCRFTRDQVEFENFLYRFWQARTVEFTSIVL